MKIERLREPFGFDGRFTVRLDTGEALRLLPAVVADFGLFEGCEIEDGTLRRIREANAKASAKARAVRIVSASGVSKRELRQRLVRKGESEDDAAGAVVWLEDLNLLDDRKTAQQLVASAVRKGYGRNRIKQILYQKGIPRELWEEALEELPEPEGAIEQFLSGKLRGRTPDQKEWKKLVDALMRRGYRWSEIQPVLGRYANAPDDEMEEP